MLRMRSIGNSLFASRRIQWAEAYSVKQENAIRLRTDLNYLKLGNHFSHVSKPKTFSTKINGYIEQTSQNITMCKTIWVQRNPLKLGRTPLHDVVVNEFQFQPHQHQSHCLWRREPKMLELLEVHWKSIELGKHSELDFPAARLSLPELPSFPEYLIAGLLKSGFEFKIAHL